MRTFSVHRVDVPAFVSIPLTSIVSVDSDIGIAENAIQIRFNGTVSAFGRKPLGELNVVFRTAGEFDAAAAILFALVRATRYTGTAAPMRYVRNRACEPLLTLLVPQIYFRSSSGQGGSMNGAAAAAARGSRQSDIVVGSGGDGHRGGGGGSGAGVWPGGEDRAAVGVAQHPSKGSDDVFADIASFEAARRALMERVPRGASAREVAIPATQYVCTGMPSAQAQRSGAHGCVVN